MLVKFVIEFCRRFFESSREVALPVVEFSKQPKVLDDSGKTLVLHQQIHRQKCLPIGRRVPERTQPRDPLFSRYQLGQRGKRLINPCLDNRFHAALATFSESLHAEAIQHPVTDPLGKSLAEPSIPVGQPAFDPCSLDRVSQLMREKPHTLPPGQLDKLPLVDEYPLVQSNRHRANGGSPRRKHNVLFLKLLRSGSQLPSQQL